MNTIVNFIRGLHGMGVVIQISYDHSRVIFDFGAPFEPLNQIYDGTVLPRYRNRLKDSLLLNKAPMVDYVYSQKDLQDIPLCPSEESPFQTAIFISHAHLDHMSEIDKVDANIPVYIHEKGLELLHVLEEIGESEHVRDYCSFQYHQTIQVGCIQVTPYFSDHTCIGSAGFLIETPDSRIYYSGDIRFHGLQYQKAYQEITLFNQNIDLLIVDSTTTSPSESVYDQDLIQQYQTPSMSFLKGCITEKDIYDDVDQQLQNTPSLAFFNLYHRDIRMLENMLQLAEKNQRVAVFQPASALIINALLKRKVHVIFPDSCTAYSYDQKVRENNIVVQKSQILNQPEHYFVQTSYRDILELTDYQGIHAKYFHLFGEPLTTKEKHYTIMKNILDRLQFEYFSYINLYSFSHAYPNHLAYFIQQVHAKAVVSVHSRKPEQLNPVSSKHYLPKERTDYQLVNGKLIELEP